MPNSDLMNLKIQAKKLNIELEKYKQPSKVYIEIENQQYLEENLLSSLAITKDKFEEGSQPSHSTLKVQTDNNCDNSKIINERYCGNSS